MDARAAAREYLSREWSPIPVPSGSKRPILPAWQQLRVVEADIDPLFAGAVNVGLLLGEPSGGLVDVDLDCIQAERLAETFLPRTEMRSGRTTRPGSHWWFRTSGSIPSTRQFEDPISGKMLIELRCTGAQTLVAPSVHPDGDTYQWDGDLEPGAVDSTTLEQSVAKVAAAALIASHWPTVAGSRHKIANALAGMLLHGGWTETPAQEFIGNVARAAGDEEARERAKAAVATARSLEQGKRVTGAPTLTGLLDSKIVEKVREWLGLTSSVGAAGATAWSPPATFRRASVPEFPTSCLPDWLRAFVEALSIATQTPMALAGALALAVVALTIARRVRVEIRAGWIEPTNLFTATSMAPGNRKSAVFAAINAPIVQYERDEAERLAPEILKAECRRRILAKALKDAEKAAAKAELEGTREGLEDVERLQQELAEVVVPVCPRFFTHDVTPEALSRLIERHTGRFAVMSAEGGVFELMAGRYGQNGGPNFDIYLKGHAGDPLRVDRVVRAGESVDSPALTIGLAFQPDVLRGLATKPSFRGRGLLGRFLYAIPVSLVGERKIGAPAVSELIRRRYEQAILTLLRATPEPVDPAHGPCIRFGADALRAMVEFETWLEPRLAIDAQLGTLADWASKLAGAVARIAAILHVAAAADVQRAIKTPLTAKTLANAIEIGRFFLSHAQAAFAEMGADPEVERGKQVLSWLRRKNLDSFTVRDAFQDLRGRFQKVSELRPALQLLVEHGYLRPVVSEQRSGPGRPPSERFEVNPLWNRNSEDIEDIEEATKDPNSDPLSSKDSTSPRNADTKSTSEVPPQNPHNPQNPGSNPEADADDEVVL